MQYHVSLIKIGEPVFEGSGKECLEFLLKNDIELINVFANIFYENVVGIHYTENREEFNGKELSEFVSKMFGIDIMYSVYCEGLLSSADVSIRSMIVYETAIINELLTIGEYNDTAYVYKI